MNFVHSYIKNLNKSNSLNALVKLLLFAGGSLAILSLTGCKEEMFTGLLNPKGLITYQERKLFFDTLALMLIVVIPVIIMSIVFAYHYRASNNVQDYKPHWSHNFYLESLWWGIPCVIIFVLAVMTWQKSHSLDPFKKIPGHKDTLLVQVVALPWKWLFIYPKQHIATVNYLEVPVGQQVEYWFTIDNVPMSSFFIPQLGSQIYVMAGMRTRLHLLASQTGTFDGLNTLYNGNGFANMHFKVHVVKPEEMTEWVAKVKNSANGLTKDVYSDLLNSSLSYKPTFYSNVADNFFNNIVMTYMMSTGPNHPRAKNNKFQEMSEE